MGAAIWDRRGSRTRALRRLLLSVDTLSGSGSTLVKASIQIRWRVATGGRGDVGRAGREHLFFFFFFSPGLDSQVFNKGMYRKRARSNSTREMYQRIKVVVRHPELLG